jgi:hypothetical protein
MSVSISINAFASTESKEFQKHFTAVKFCIENGLSYPKETSEFFKGKMNGDNLEDWGSQYILEHLQNGVEVDLITTQDKWGNETTIKVSDIPLEADKIIIKLS